MTWTPKPEYRLAENTISREDLAELAEWLGTTPTPQLTQGPLVAEFEAAFARKVDAKHAIFVNSGSSANLLAWAVAQRPGNPRAVAPAVAWATSVMPAMQLGYNPIRLCEADEETWGMDPDALRRICEKAPPAVVLLVHVLGVPCRMAEIEALRKEFGFTLIEDACGAFGSQPVGRIGDLWTYSTYFAHQLSTIEGGFVCTNDDERAERLRMLRAHGWTADLSAEAKSRWAKAADVEPFREKFTFHLPGFNVRGTDLQARIGLSQLTRADEVAEGRKMNDRLYRARFQEPGTFSVQQPLPGTQTASIGFGVLASSREHRAKVAAALAAKKIETRPVGGGNMARQPFWTARFGPSRELRPVADRIHDCGFQLPSHPELWPEDVEYIADAVWAVNP